MSSLVRGCTQKDLLGSCDGGGDHTIDSREFSPHPQDKGMENTAMTKAKIWLPKNLTSFLD